MSTTFHMSSAEFREQGHALIDWIADYHDRVAELPVLSQVEPGDIRKALPPEPPEQPEPMSAVIADLERVIMPGITHWQSPNFFAYFPCNASGPAILGELLSAGLNVQGMLWATSPACTELETHVLDWVADLLGLPDRFRSSGAGGGVIQDSASSATLVSLLAARERVIRESGVPSSKLVAYASNQAHSSIAKAVRIADIGELRLIDCDSEFAMRPDRLAEAIAADRERGLIPAFVCATLGTTSSLAFDPLGAIGAVCQRESVWLHIDAAMAGTAAICPEFRDAQAGIELADSYTFNPHKWMFTNFDCNCLYLSDRSAVIEALSIAPEYLRNQASESGAVIDYRDWQIPLGRRFRALKLWFTLRYYGSEGLRFHVRQHVELATWLADQIEASDSFDLAVPRRLNLVCFRLRGDDHANRALIDALNQSGKIYLSHTVLDGKLTLRMSIGQTHTARSHVEQAWQLIETLAS